MSHHTRVASRAAIASLSALFALTACSESAPNATAPAPLTAPDGANRLSVIGGDEVEHGLVMTTRDAESRRTFAGVGQAGVGSGIYYHGGPVLRRGTSVAAVYWASSPIYVNAPAAGTHGAGSLDGSLIGSFLRSVGGSPYYNINHTYTDGAGVKIANIVTYTQYWANRTSVPANGASVTDPQIVSMLQAGFNSGALTYNPTTVYAVFTAGTVNLGGGFGTQYCAYHWYGYVRIGRESKLVLYAAMPYNYAYPSACTSGMPAANGSYDRGADYEVNTLVHEVEETTTDPTGTAWYDNSGYENADKCAWTWGTVNTATNGGKYNITIGGRNYLVQRNWTNAPGGGCVLSA